MLRSSQAKPVHTHLQDVVQLADYNINCSNLLSSTNFIFVGFICILY